MCTKYFADPNDDGGKGYKGTDWSIPIHEMNPASLDLTFAYGQKWVTFKDGRIYEDGEHDITDDDAKIGKLMRQFAVDYDMFLKGKS